MKSIIGIVIEYDSPSEEDDKNATAIGLNSLNSEETMIQINSDNFLKFLNNNKDYIELDERIDLILENCKRQISKEIENYKLDLEDANDQKEIRYLRADIREKLKAIGDFSKEVIEIIGQVMKYIIGIGTGRCGSQSLSKLFSKQKGFASFHELYWTMSGSTFRDKHPILSIKDNNMPEKYLSCINYFEERYSPYQVNLI